MNPGNACRLNRGLIIISYIFFVNKNKWFFIHIFFDAEFNRVVEEKQIEEQKIKTAEYKKRQAEQNKLTAILEAEGEARKQELLRQSVIQQTIELKWIEKWDGKLPTYMRATKP